MPRPAVVTLQPVSAETISRVTIRRARSDDNALLAILGAETFADSFGADNTPEDMELYLARAFSPERQAAELAEPNSAFLIAEIGGDAAGYARIRETAPPPEASAARALEIVRFYSRTVWIGRGVGAALMRACLDEAAQRGCDLVWLQVWERNARAIDFYSKWGFTARGAREFRLGNDVQRDHLMVRAPV